MLLCLCGAVSGAAAQQKIASSYQEWLNGPTSYLITKNERDLFLHLKTDEERDRLIEKFWELRNPHPGTGNNEFKEEFYRRLAYVNAFYGKDAGSDGWRTDRGRTYLLFGKPQQVTSLIHNQELYPAELWFYSSANALITELPPFFYVLFFDRDGIGGYRFYQPAIDSPDKIVRSSSASTASQAYQYLRSINPEFARATLSLIPGEPVDTDTFSGSMASQSILHAAQGYNQMPSYVALIRQRELRLERVTSHIEYDLARAGLLTFVAWEKGDAWVHWQFQVSDPKNPKAIAGKAEYRIAARLYSDNKLVFERNDAPFFPVPVASEEDFRRRPFIYEDRMPVVPGRYRLTVTARNTASGLTYEASRDFAVPGGSDRALLSDIFVVSRFEPDQRQRPFQFGGIKFFPDPAGFASVNRGLRICYQIALQDPRPAELHVEYVMGQITSTRFHKSFEDKLDLSAADAFGTLVIGKTLSTVGLSPGGYQLAVRITDPRTGLITGSSAPFTIADDAGEVQPVVVSQGHPDTPQWLAANQYERALCWLAQGRSREAETALAASLKFNQNPAVRGLLERLQGASGPSRPVTGTATIHEGKEQQ